MIRAVVFDVGETLVDETRNWSGWADFLGVPRFTFFGAMGVVIANGWHHRRVFDLVRPGLDWRAALAEREAAGWRYGFEPGDFYPDAIPCLRALRDSGYKVGLAGNQPEEAEGALEALGLPADFIASSARWGMEKPSPDFFVKVVEAAGVAADEVAYVGDRLDNDVLPAAEAGMMAIFLRRGPWGVAHALDPRVERAAARLEGLDELPPLLAAGISVPS